MSILTGKLVRFKLIRLEMNLVKLEERAHAMPFGPLVTTRIVKKRTNGMLRVSGT
jgi:hypothetical protein